MTQSNDLANHDSIKKYYPVIFAFILIVETGCGELEQEDKPSPIDQKDQRIIIPEHSVIEDSGLDKIQDQSNNELIRVIVKLKSKDEGSVETISEQQDILLSKLSDSKYRVTRRYMSLPLIALEIDKDSYQILEALPEVESVEVDALYPVSPMWSN